MHAIKAIKTEIMKKLTNVSTLNRVYSYERINPEGFPCAFVTFDSNDNEFFTNAENKRVYGYRVLILAQIGQDRSNSDRVQAAEEAIEEAVGDVLNSLDSDITLGSNSQVLYVEAALGQPGYVEYEGGWARSAEITIRVHSIYVV